MRSIRYAKHFDEAVKRIGGYEVVDLALEPIIDAISLNPYGFPIIESDFTRCDM
jgi:hypothetical protein